MNYPTSGVSINKSNQKAGEYYEYRKEMDRVSREFQDYLIDRAWEAGLVISPYTSPKYQLSKGEGRAGVEIKYDMRLAETGNLYLETEEKGTIREGKYVKAGIYSKGHWLFAIGDYETVYIFATSTLQLLDGMDKWKRIETQTSKGFLLPRAYAEKYAALVLRGE